MYLALLIINVMMFMLVVALCMRHRAFSIFHPAFTYIMFHGFVFVFRPVLSWYYGYTFIYNLYQFNPSDHVKYMALVVANVGLIAFVTTSFRWGNAPFFDRYDRFTALELTHKLRSLCTVSVLLLPLIIWSLLDAWSLRSTTADTLILDQATGTTINTSGNGYFQSLYNMGVILTPLIAWTFRFRWWSMTPVVAFTFVQAGSGLRGPMVSTLTCLTLLYLYSRRQRWPTVRYVVPGLIAALLFNIMGADRGHAIRQFFVNDVTEVTHSESAMSPLEGMDFGSLEYLEFMIDVVPEATGTYEYFVDNLQIFTEPVPRAFWKNKPIGQPIRLFYLFDYGNPIGITRSLPGEGWTQLGLVGVVLWCGLWGGVVGAVYNTFIRSKQNVLQVAAYVAFLVTLLVFYRDGSMLTLLRQYLFFVPAILLWALVSRVSGTITAEQLRRSAAWRLARESNRKPPLEPKAVSKDASLRLLPRSLRHPRETPDDRVRADVSEGEATEKRLPRSLRHRRPTARA